MYIIFIIIAIVLIFLVVRNLLMTPPAPRVLPEHKTGAAIPHDMVRCAYCGLHIPATEAITQHDNHFCTTEHLEMHKTSQS